MLLRPVICASIFVRGRTHRQAVAWIDKLCKEQFYSRLVLCKISTLILHIFSTVLRNMIGAVPTGRKRNINLNETYNFESQIGHKQRQIMWGLSILV